MRIGIPREVKRQEYRVGLAPAAVARLAEAGHDVTVEAGAGADVGFSDEQYLLAGAQVTSVDAVFDSELIVKVKEPQPVEWQRLRQDHVLFCYLHLAACPELARYLVDAGVTAIACETVTDKDGSLPLLAPMSEIAGRMSIQVGAYALQCASGGRGVLLSGATGVMPASVVILGGGVAGVNAARMALGLGADVTIIEKAPARLMRLRKRFGNRARVLSARPVLIEYGVRGADLVVGAALVPGAAAPKLLSRELVRSMRDGAVLVDICIDQGGCSETSRPTTHDAPTYVEEGVVHYCVTNMPGAVARTSTLAFNNVALPFVQTLADKGWRTALADDPCLARGLNVHAGRIRHPAVAEALGAGHRCRAGGGKPPPPPGRGEVSQGRAGAGGGGLG
ncbi:MAG: alanine dehydrogenase, partial [Gammaproteobacteria bacterium]|nr:alanine dehydrogenase [Gammaproteobacteria bacterium]